MRPRCVPLQRAFPWIVIGTVIGLVSAPASSYGQQAPKPENPQARTFPDVDRFGMFNYVGEGFDISGTQLLISFLLLVGYLLPWAVLAYYLIKWREIATA